MCSRRKIPHTFTFLSGREKIMGRTMNMNLNSSSSSWARNASIGLLRRSECSSRFTGVRDEEREFEVRGRGADWDRCGFEPFPYNPSYLPHLEPFLRNEARAELDDSFEASLVSVNSSAWRFPSSDLEDSDPWEDFFGRLLFAFFSDFCSWTGSYCQTNE